MNGNDQQVAGMIALLERVVDRLEALEIKVDAIVTPPKALRIEDAERHLPLKRAAIKQMIRDGEIRTVRIKKRRYIPLTEIIRLTTVIEKPGTAPGLSNKAGPSKKQRGGVPEHEKIRALLKKR